MDFVSDALFDGRRLRALTAVDAFTRDALAIDIAQGIKGEQVVEAMTRITLSRGAPKIIRVDNVLCGETLAGSARRSSGVGNVPTLM